MKKILIMIPRMGGGGAERVVSIIANNLSKSCQIQITTLVSGESFYRLSPSVKLISGGFVINRSNKFARLFSMGKNFISSICFTKKTIKEYKPDIILSMLEEMDIVTWIASRGLTGFKWICSERNDPTQRNVKLQKLLEYIYQKSDMLVCQSAVVSDYYSMVDKKVVIPNPVDFSNYPKRVKESAPPKIVSIGRLVPQKNIELLIDAFSDIADEYPNVNVIVYGEGMERKSLEERINSYGLMDRFFLPGVTNNVLDKIKDAAVFAFSTNYEGFPNVLVEAIAMGIPVISTDFATGIAKEIIDKNVGCVVPCGNREAFAKAIKKVLDDTEWRKRIRNNNCETIAEFDIENVIKKWEQILEI